VAGPMGVLSTNGKVGRADRSARSRPAWTSQAMPGASQRQYQHMRSSEGSPVQLGCEGTEMQIMDTSELGDTFADDAFCGQSTCSL
jgi:hypothetical protein